MHNRYCVVIQEFNCKVHLVESVVNLLMFEVSVIYWTNMGNYIFSAWVSRDKQPWRYTRKCHPFTPYLSMKWYAQCPHLAAFHGAYVRWPQRLRKQIWHFPVGSHHKLLILCVHWKSFTRKILPRHACVRMVIPTAIFWTKALSGLQSWHCVTIRRMRLVQTNLGCSFQNAPEYLLRERFPGCCYSV